MGKTEAQGVVYELVAVNAKAGLDLGRLTFNKFSTQLFIRWYGVGDTEYTNPLVEDFMTAPRDLELRSGSKKKKKGQYREQSSENLGETSTKLCIICEEFQGLGQRLWEVQKAA